ncbi:UPF0272 protein [Desulfosarcina widdelii]|uniref:Putative nickel insertion protein n=2 Tax=Desulfosarcina widdelii TaxID=947919 RepID=A0A5K7Z9V1_9BACT|nr:UPF0272 protein [Desulfosarcina widdelii]
MFLGAFVDMGVPIDWLQKRIHGIGLEKFDIVARDVKKNGIGAKQVTVIEKGHSHPRNYGDIVRLIDDGALSDKVKKASMDIFSRIAEAEAKVHRCEIEDVHFHEVGAVDSIVDIVGAALCLDYFNIESSTSSPLPLGSGFVDCAHGKLPIPAPATLEILNGIPVYGGSSDGEQVTPTGAGIIASIAREFGPIPPMKIERIGYGSGSRETCDTPNLLRVFAGVRTDAQSQVTGDAVCVVETNIDDMNPELYGYVMEKLFQEGALDVCLIPGTMKKNRPGTKIEVLCPPEKKDAVAACLLAETSTIGVRYQWVQRDILKRFKATVKTRFGEIQVKCVQGPSGHRRCTPEFDSCRKVAQEKNVPLAEIYDVVTGAVQDENLLTFMD